MSDNQSSSTGDSSVKSSFSRTVEHIVNGKAGKMFVGGLNPSTVADGLRSYFSQFGQVEDAIVMRDAKTGLSRGFGFVIFVDPLVIEKVCAVTQHLLDGKKKLFIGGVSQQTTAEDLKKYFSKFGEVEDLVLKANYAKGQHRGFGFVTFCDDSVFDVVCSIRYHNVDGKVVETKPAQKKEFVNLSPTKPTMTFCGMDAQMMSKSNSSSPLSDSPASSSSYDVFSSEPVFLGDNRFIDRIYKKYTQNPKVEII